MSGVLYRVAEPTVAMQVIDGEAVLISFETGSYYSARGIGAGILELLRQPRSVTSVAEGLAASGTARVDGTAIGGYVDHLVREGLVVATDVGGTPIPAPDDGHGRGDGWTTLIAPPEKFTDLEDLLLLDPIHDADAAGWPVARTQPEHTKG